MTSMFLIKAIVIVILMAMGLQDFKFRAISWYLFPALALGLLLMNPAFSLYSCFINFGFVALVFVLLTGWFSLRSGSLVNLTQRHLGIGDVLFLLCLAFFFSPLNFFLFYLLSLLSISIGTGLYLLAFKPKDFTIPLAGLQGLTLAAVLVICWFLNIDLSHNTLLPDFLMMSYERS